MTDEFAEHATYQPPTPSQELARLSPLVGEWVAEDLSVDGPGGPAAPVTLFESFRWLEGGFFLESRYRVNFGDAPTSYGVMYWGFDDDSGAFKTIYFNDQGPYHERFSRYEGVINGDTLTFTGPARVRYTLAVDGTIQVDADGRIRAEWWLRDDTHNGEWRPWRPTTYRRAT